MRYLSLIGMMAGVLFTVYTPPVQACGGFFCQFTPINQAAEQIVFRQDGNQITAMVQIQYVGDADDFSWVVPVPTTPEFSVGSNTVFTDLEPVTRPQFNLSVNGSGCEPDFAFANLTPVASEDVSDDSSGVTVESVQDVGGYVVTLVSGDNAESMSQWLIDNNYDLTARGEELLAPYVEAGMKFVAVKLQQNRGIGSIQPLIMKYESDKPEIPIRLTAIAALDDMGVLVWLLGDARAVPENYLHVTPNYTSLNWFSGTQNAYASYQQLVTNAMNEAGGQGFATDYAGQFNNLLDALTSVEDLQQQRSRLTASTDVEYLRLVQVFFRDSIVTETMTNNLPLSSGQSAANYFDANFLSNNYTAAELLNARNEVDRVLREEVIDPLQASLDVLAGDRYLTRLYTTLSADEMTLDPTFVFNSDMPGQQLDRNATLDLSCVEDNTNWKLTLQEGTGRQGEVVIDTIGLSPIFNPPVVPQAASWKLETTSADGLPQVQQVRQFPVASLGAPTAAGACIDTDGDGWGWDGTASCVAASGLPEPEVDAAACVDTDGDGYGWDGTATCIPGASTPTQNTAQCIDTDGDGYGWDGTATCIPDTTPSTTPETQCIDTDGDGYGWDGTATCIP